MSSLYFVDFEACLDMEPMVVLEVPAFLVLPAALGQQCFSFPRRAPSVGAEHSPKPQGQDFSGPQQVSECIELSLSL